MPRLREKVVEKVRCLLEEILESILNFIDYLNVQEAKIRQFEARYGSFNDLKSKVLKEEHTWEEEKDPF